MKDTAVGSCDFSAVIIRVSAKGKITHRKCVSYQVPKMAENDFLQKL
ncbi:MAG: hypothetical protein LBJ19_02365 [Holosporaceae bacterium]|jgi:hypothetical protein|nr:hypothetical protein [Holosporaceae bacterium]